MKNAGIAQFVSALGVLVRVALSWSTNRLTVVPRP